MRLWQWFLFVGSLFLLHWGLRNLWCHYSQKVKRTLRRALLALALLAGLAGTARATTNYYVSTTGSDSNPCSLAQPCLTIAHTQTVVQTATASVRLGAYYFTITPTSATNQTLFYDLSLAPADFWSHVRSDGGDIRVTTQDGTTQVAREVSAFNSTAHTGAIYINTNGGTAAAFCVYYGSGAAEPPAAATYGKYNAWESAAKLVAHLEDTSDSTVNQNVLANQGAVSSQTGKVAKAYTFNGTSQYIDTGSNVGNFGSSDSFAVLAWINIATDGSDRVIFGNTWGTRGWLLRKTSTNKIRFIVVDSAIIYSGMDSNALGSGWHRIVGIWNGSAASVYVDGSPASITPITQGAMSNISTSAHTMIGLDTLADGHYFSGTVDEVMVLKRVPSSTEVANDFANQNAPGSFWISGAATVAGTPPNITVFLRGGTYQQSTGLTFGASDSGNVGNPVLWQSYPGERAVISGGTPVTGWSLYSGSIYRANVGIGWNFRQLYVNGAHAQRARGPSNPGGWTRTATGYTAPDSSMSTWGNPAAIEIVSLGLWSMDRCQVVSIAGTAITMTSTCWTNQEGILPGHVVRSTPSWVENAYELMAPGYWYLNQATGYLYYWPPSGSMTGVTVVAPVVDNLLTISGANSIQFGTSANPLVFAYSNWTGPSSAMGYVGVQSGYAVTIFGVTNQVLDAAVTVSGSSGINFAGNQFSHLGSRGILIMGGSADITISGNRFDDNAAGALQVGDPGPCAGGCLPFVQESNVTVTSNRISSGNAFDYIDNGAIFAPAMTGSSISNNEIDNTPWVPIAIGWGGWGGVTRPYATNNSISGNNINGYCLWPVINADCGGIYSNGAQSSSSSYATGLVVNGNFMRGGASTEGLYPDESSSWSVWSNNVVQSTTSQWLHIWTSSINNLQITNNYTDNATMLNSGTNITISGTSLISSGTQPFGTPQQAIICAAGVPGSTACTTPTTWPTWQSGVGATWSRPQIGP